MLYWLTEWVCWSGGPKNSCISLPVACAIRLPSSHLTLLNRPPTDYNSSDESTEPQTSNNEPYKPTWLTPEMLGSEQHRRVVRTAQQPVFAQTPTTRTSIDFSTLRTPTEVVQRAVDVSRELRPADVAAAYTAIARMQPPARGKPCNG